MVARTAARAQTPARAVMFDVRKRWSEQTPEVLPFSLPDGMNFVPSSWSADGRLALTATGPDPSAGTYIYDFETRQVQKVSSERWPLGAGAFWLSDNRRLLVGSEGRLYLINPAAGKSHEVLSVLPDAITGYSLSRDDRLIVYALRSNKADIWLASADDRPTGRPR